ncbi:hypothetical protein [Geomonas limicola]|uniref:hypothetical protein n=1 Tax=Geomonas limicola TaxID=2740186 RepID=UPI00160B34CB|nr:hypothetical protein [Geomonas limicola]
MTETPTTKNFRITYEVRREGEIVRRSQIVGAPGSTLLSGSSPTPRSSKVCLAASCA